MKKVLSVLLISSMFFMSACSSLSSLIEKPGVSVADFALKDLNANSQTFTVRLKVDNPNGFSLPIAGLDYGLNILGTDVLNGSNATGVRIPANGSDFIDLDLSVDLVKSIPGIARALKNSNGNLSYGLNGAVKLDSPLIKNVPFSKTGEYKLSLSDLLKFL